MTVATRRAFDGGFTVDFQTAGGVFDPVVETPPALGGFSKQANKVLVVDSVSVDGLQVVPTTRECEADRARYRIVVGGVDVTYFRGAQTPLPTYGLVSPLLYGSGSITFPQIHAAYERPGVGALSWLKKFATVRVQRVDDEGTVLGTDYIGEVTDYEHDGRSLTCTLGGQATGRAAMVDRETIPFPFVTDIGKQALSMVRGACRVPIGRIPTTGISVLETGGTGSQLDWLTSLLAQSTTLGGAMWTVMPNSATGVYRMFQKDTETIDASVYIDGYRAVESLKRDFTEEPNRVWATAVGPDGLRIRNAIYPGLDTATRPTFPGTLSPGDSGDGVLALRTRLYAAGYLGDGVTAWTTDSDDPITEAVEDLQADAGLTVTGVVNAATWNALYSLDTTGYSLRGAAVLPMAARPYTYPWLRNASGQVIGRNPKFDRTRPVVDVSVDMGAGFTPRQVRQWSKQELADDNTSNWVGTITVNTGAVIDGEHNPGDPLTSDLVRDARTIKPGMNLWLPTWDGGTLIHVSGVNVQTGSVQFIVDTRARDTMKAWQVIKRNRESRRNPSRQWIAQNRRSGMRDDTGAFYDGGVFGKIDRTFCPADTWTPIAVPAGRSGILQRIDIQTEGDEVAFGLWISGHGVTSSWLDRKVGDPSIVGFAENAQSNTKDWENSRSLIDVWGQKGQLCGYWPRSQNALDGSGDSGAPITGRFVFKAGAPYLTRKGVLTVAVRPVGHDTFVTGGRVLTLLLDDSAG